MNRLALFAETPRAGELGHRFLAGNNDQVPDRQIAEYVKCVDKDVSLGTNFIGVARSVQQRSGTAIRVSREILVLTGVDVQRISGESRDRVLELLRDLLHRLERLVLNGINWSRLPLGDLVIRNPEFSRWLEEIEDLTLPKTEWLQGPKPLPATDCLGSVINRGDVDELNSEKVPTRPGREVPRALSIVLIVLVSSILIAAVVRFINSSRQMAADGGSNQSNETLFQSDRNSERAILELAKEWECSPEDTVHSLLRAANWDRRGEADSMKLETALKDGDVRRLLQELTSKNGVDRLFVAPKINTEPDLRRFVQSDPSRSIGECRDVRVWLYDAWGKWKRVRESVSKVTGTLGESYGQTDFFAMMVALAQLQPEVGLGEEFRKPVTPLFDRQDVMIWHFLNRCRSTLEDRGINKFLGKPIPNPPVSELASFSAAIRNSRDIARLIANDRRLRNPGDNQQADSLDIAYVKFDDFIHHLGEIHR